MLAHKYNSNLIKLKLKLEFCKSYQAIAVQRLLKSSWWQSWADRDDVIINTIICVSKFHIVKRLIMYGKQPSRYIHFLLWHIVTICRLFFLSIYLLFLFYYYFTYNYSRHLKIVDRGVPSSPPLNCYKNRGIPMHTFLELMINACTYDLVV